METNIDVVRTHLKAVAAGDVDGIVDSFASDGKMILASGPEPGSTYERSEIAGVYHAMKDQFVGLTANWSDPVSIDDGRILSEFLISDSEGKVLHRGVDIFQVRDGKIAVKDAFSKA